MALITKEQRQKVEDMIYNVLDSLDETKTNSDYYRNIFSGMNDDEFFLFFKKNTEF